MKLAIASDHGGYSLKKEIIELLKGRAGLDVEDLGCHSVDSVDYPDFAALVAERVSQGKVDRGILVCGTGTGMAISANKFPGVRAAAITDLFTARMAREHNDLNVLCLGGRVLGGALAAELTKIFLDTPFAGDRHAKRVDKIKQLERRG